MIVIPKKLIYDFLESKGTKHVLDRRAENIHLLLEAFNVESISKKLLNFKYFQKVLSQISKLWIILSDFWSKLEANIRLFGALIDLQI